MTTSSWYRRSIWTYKGNREYTHTGYEAAKARFIDHDLDVDCTDRHYMITGCNSGIGLQVALEVARRGGVIHMVCRNEDLAKKARSEIITTTGNDKIHLHIVDLARPREVVLWVERFAAQHDRLHVLVNNAGCMIHERQLDEDGVEVNFAVNTLAVYIITTTLCPLLQKNEDARVVMVSSAGMLTVRLDPHDLMHLNLEPWNGTLVYSQNKRHQVVMSLWYAQRYDKIHFSSMHPGWADTNAIRKSIPQFYEEMKENLRTPAQGADTVVWLAISKSALKHPGGLFFQDREPVATHLPLAWTKSSIEEEDLLMKNIHDIFTKVYERAHWSPVSQPPVEAEGEGNAETVEQDLTTSTHPTEDNTSHTIKEETKPKEVELVRIPPPPEPRRIDPPVSQASEEPKHQEEELGVSEDKESNKPADTDFEEFQAAASSKTTEAEKDSKPTSPEVYVTPEKPKMEEIAATHNTVSKILENPAPETTDEPIMETPKSTPSVLLVPAASDEKQGEEADQSSSDKNPAAPSQDSTEGKESDIKDDTNAISSP